MSDLQQIYGWAAIAEALGRTIRTVMRWEKEMGLPIVREGRGKYKRVVLEVGMYRRWKAMIRQEQRKTRP